MTPAHHPLIQAMQPWRGWVWPGEVVNWLGVRRLFAYHPVAPKSREYAEGPGWRCTSRPGFEEEYFEWIALLEATDAARGEFTMLELGAGYGRWSVNAAALCSRCRLPFHLVAVEAEPTHFRWLQDNFRRNRLSGDQHELIHAAIAAQDGQRWFYTGSPAERYGQGLVIGPDVRKPPGWQVEQVRGVAFKSILARYPTIDLIDADLQGAELEVFASAPHELAAEVRSVTIGTHNAAAESGLRDLFTGLGWINLADFEAGPPGSEPATAEYVTHDTPYGPITFLDGVQRWINPARCS